MYATLQHPLPAPVGETPPSLEARRPTPRHRDSPKYRLFFMPSRGNANLLPSGSGNRGLSTLRGNSGVAAVAAEETAHFANYYSNNNYNMNNATTTTATTTATTSTTSTTNTGLLKSDYSTNSTLLTPVVARRIAVRRSTMEHTGGDAKHVVKPSPTNVVQWLQHACPAEILPKVLAFAGPQKSWSLMKTNRFWYHLITNDATWRVMCEETYKWKEGDAWPATTWREFYRLNPCVPIDYSTIHRAMTIACQPSSHLSTPPPRPSHYPQHRSIRIFVRPGKHYLKESIVIHCTRDVQVTVETMKLPSTLYHPSPFPALALPKAASPNKQTQESAVSPTTPRGAHRQVLQRAATFHHLVWNGCRSNRAVDETEVEEDADILESPSQEDMPSPPLDSPPKRATLVMRTRRHNEPIVRVRQGHLKMVNVDLHHTSYGLDIWNGNAAVQVQPPMVTDEVPMMVDPSPSIELQGVEVMSRSGRGIVNIDGGQCIIRNCYIHDCAATGIYVGGPGSQAHIERTDVIRNGNGNLSSRRGIGRGHSGIYLEQGHALIRDCNISRNSLTGVSAISPDNAVLSLEGSDLVANGTFQLEMPNMGSMSRRRSITRDNNLAVVGLARSRSGLVGDEP